MDKITGTIDLMRIDKNKIITRTYTNKAGEEITVKEYSFDVVARKDPKTIKEGDTWALNESHFITDAPTKDERADKVKMNIVGRGIQIINKRSTTADEARESINQTLGRTPPNASNLTVDESNTLKQARTAHNIATQVKSEDDYGDTINPEDIPF